MLKSRPKRQNSGLILTTLRAIRSVPQRTQPDTPTTGTGAPRVECCLAARRRHGRKRVCTLVKGRFHAKGRVIEGFRQLVFFPRLSLRFPTHFGAISFFWPKSQKTLIMLFSRFWPQILGSQIACNFIGALLDYPTHKF